MNDNDIVDAIVELRKKVSDLHMEVNDLKKQNENLEHRISQDIEYRIKQLERAADSDSHY
jgi:predicted  nucleic acid-binding Zn-ribbon protein